MFTNRLCLSTWSDIKTLVCRYYKIRDKIIIRKLHKIQNIVRDTKVPELISNGEQKLIKVAIIGVPNAGKSTLINNMMDRKVCPASNKVHTTRKRSHAIITEGKTQVVFLDTPGVISAAEQKKYKLEKTFMKDCVSSLNESDIIGVIHDVSNTWTRERIDIKVIKLLEQHNKKQSFLVLNKIDEMKSKRKLLDLTRMLTENCLNSMPFGKFNKPQKVNSIRGWPNFSEVFMVSALHGDGVQVIKKYLIEQSHPSNWMYLPNEWTDQSPEDVIVKTVQATLLDFLPQEIPYKLKTEMEFFEMGENGIINAVVLVHCPLDRIKKLVVGVGDGKLRQITEKAQKDLLQTFNDRVRLRIVVQSDADKKEKELKLIV